MNTKSFLALTVIAAAASSAMAQSSLNIYGNVDASVTHTKNESSAWALSPATNKSTTAVSSGTMSESFIGFKGTEDLGSGMEASFVLETYLDVDTGATSSNRQLLSAVSRLLIASTPLGPTFASTATWNLRDEGGFWAKNAHVSLKTNYGMIRLGQMDNLGYLSAVKYNPFGTAAINPTMRVFYGTDFYARAWSNTAAYFIKLGDVTGAVLYAPKNDNAPGLGQQGGAKYALSGRYETGPLSLAAGYESNKDNVSSAGTEAKSATVHGSYDLSVAKLFASLGWAKNDATGAGQDVISKGYSVGVSVPVGSGAFMASFANGKLEADNSATFSAGTTFRDVDVFSLGYNHSLSKRTSAYAAYLDESDSYPVATLSNLKIKTQQFSIGVRHSF